jgi:predicted RecA/RadA family phage recombinase
MADITAFPTLTHIVDQGEDRCRRYKAGAAIKAGMVVAFEASGTSNQVVPAVRGTTGSVVGVAAKDAASGEMFNVYIDGAFVYCVNADDTTAIDAGAPLAVNDNAVGGTVSAAQGAAVASGELVVEVVGVAQEDIAGGATGIMKIQTQCLNRTSA